MAKTNRELENLLAEEQSVTGVQEQTIEQQAAELARLRAELQELRNGTSLVTLPNGDLYRVAKLIPGNEQERPDTVEMSALEKAKVEANIQRMLGGAQVQVQGGYDPNYVRHLEAQVAQNLNPEAAESE